MSPVMIWMRLRACPQRLARVPNLTQRALNVMLQFVEFQWILLPDSSPLLECFRSCRLGCRRRRSGKFVRLGGCRRCS